MLVNSPLGYMLLAFFIIGFAGFIYENNKFLKNFKEYGLMQSYKMLLSEGILKKMLGWIFLVFIVATIAHYFSN